MKRFHSDVGSAKAALEQRPEILKAVSVYATLYVGFRVIHHVMYIQTSQFVIGDRIVAVQLRSKLNLIQNRSLQSLAFYIRDHGCTHLTLIAIKHSMHSSFSEMFESLRVNGLAALGEQCCLAPLVHIAKRSADKGFIGFYFAAILAEVGSAERFVLHGQPNPVQHEPSRLLSNLHASSDLIAADSVLAIGNHPSCHHPLVERDCGILHHGSDLDGEFAFGMVLGASPGTALLAEFNSLAPAGRANDLAVWPSPNSKIINAVVGVREVDNSFLKACRFGFHGRFHEQNYSLKQWSSQVNYCPPPACGIIELGSVFPPKSRAQRTYLQNIPE